MSTRFRFTVGSEPEFEDLVGDLYFEDQIVCVLTQKGGFYAMQIQLYGPPGGGSWMFALSEFEDSLATLKKSDVGASTERCRRFGDEVVT